MDRRAFLAALAAATAGCAAPGSEAPGDRERVTAADPPATATATEVEAGPPGRYGVPETICEEAPREDHGIDAVTDPAFGAGWADHEVPDSYRARDAEGPGLAPDRTVIGLESDPPRAYPISVLRTHEVVNDRVRLGGGERPVLVTYCPLCRSGMVADRTLRGTVAEFTVTGLLWQAPRIQEAAAEKDGRVFGARATGGEELSVRRSGNLVMEDDVTGSYWSQILAQAICGPSAGEFLGVVPSAVTTWGAFREREGARVLLPPPHSGTV